MRIFDLSWDPRIAGMGSLSATSSRGEGGVTTRKRNTGAVDRTRSYWGQPLRSKRGLVTLSTSPRDISIYDLNHFADVNEMIRPESFFAERLFWIRAALDAKS